MNRYSQTIARLGAGYSVIGCVVWLLWPQDFGFASNPEAWVSLTTAFVVWHAIELKKSEAPGSSRLSANDVRLARDLLEWHSGDLRYVLKDTDLWMYVESDVYMKLSSISHRYEIGELFFHNKKLAQLFRDFTHQLDEFNELIAVETVPEMIGGVWKTGFKPFGIVLEEEYRRRREQSKKANNTAQIAWKLLDQCVVHIKRYYPEVLEKPLRDS